MTQAACADKDQKWFYGEEEGEGKKRHRPTLTMAEVKRAKEVCASCPVINECYDYAIENDERYGIWGGTTGRERRRIRESNS